MRLILSTSTADWSAWVGYELLLALVVFAKSISRFRRGFPASRAGLQSWVGLLLVALFAAIELGRRLNADFLPPPPPSLAQTCWPTPE